MSQCDLYRGFRYPATIISHVVWLYFRFSLSFRDIEELVASRGIFVTYESIRQWTLKFGQTYANALRRRQPKRGDKWHLDEVVLTFKGAQPLPVACGRPAGAYARCAGAAPARPTGRQTLLSQAAQGAAVRAAGAGHGQAQELWRGESATHSGHRTPAAQGTQQPGRSLAPADPAAGTPDEAIQIAGAGPTLFIGAWSDQQRLPLSAPPLAGGTVPVCPEFGFFTLE